MSRIFRTTLVLAAIGVAAAIASFVSTDAVAAPDMTGRRLAFDVAMDGSSFHFEGEMNENNAPKDGTPFIIRGYIYPEGTFDMHGALSGTRGDGQPEFPEQVVGTWYCSGWHLQDGDAETGPVVVTTQIFDLYPNKPGHRTITSEGIELADFDVPFLRSITGGTGPYADAKGQLVQTYVGNGLNASEGFNTSFEIRVR